ncbi:MAG: amine oxidase [Rhodospirillales bacterium]|nr:amine oxidase [Rhodospirillales bacterium]
MVMTRRDLINRIGRAGGFGAAFVAMQGLGLIPTGAQAAALALPAGAGKGIKVVILGGGVAGLTAAYELGKAGYQCTILEARERTGGRNFTARRGTKIEMNDGTLQVCAFDEGQYFNAGAARLPNQHTAILGYCREFGVELEVEVNADRSAYVWNDHLADQKPIQMRQAVNDTRGRVSELLAKAIDAGRLDKELTGHDRERMIEFLRTYGDLSPDLLYKGSIRSGYKDPPGAGDRTGIIRDPLEMSALLDADMWNGVMFEEIIDMQATMFQPLGGMDRISAAFEKRLGPVVQRSCPVKEIRRTPNGVSVIYQDSATGKPRVIGADYCICTIPIPVLRTILSDFSETYRNAMADIAYGNAVKIAWQSRRFWETEDQIYGGISFVKSLPGMIWYPSTKFMSDKGILIGAYAADADADSLSAKLLSEQFALSRKAIDGLHPGHGKDLDSPIGIAWSKIPYSLGNTARWKPGQEQLYALLDTPDGPFYFAGEHLSHIGGWQEGAILSAHRAVRAIDKHRRATRP